VITLLTANNPAWGIDNAARNGSVIGGASLSAA